MRRRRRRIAAARGGFIGVVVFAALGVSAMTAAALPLPNDLDGDGIPDATECAPLASEALINLDFEIPAVEGQGQFRDTTTPGIGWSTSEKDHMIELWGAGSKPAAASGTQFVEVNANTDDDDLYQDIPTKPGSVYYWSFAHRGRDSASIPDVLDLQAGPPEGPAFVAEAADTNGAWGTYSGYYVVPPGQRITRWRFLSILPSVPGGSSGNFLDATSLRRCVDTDGDGVPDIIDTDSDADGLPDVFEGTGDSDHDGVPNYRDLPLTATKTVAPLTGTTVSPGDTIRISYVFRIQGYLATTFALRDSLPDGLTYVAGSLQGSTGTANDYGGTATLTLSGESLSIDGIERVSIDALVPPGAALGTFGEAGLVSGLTAPFGNAGRQSTDDPETPGAADPTMFTITPGAPPVRVVPPPGSVTSPAGPIAPPPPAGPEQPTVAPPPRVDLSVSVPRVRGLSKGQAIIYRVSVRNRGRHAAPGVILTAVVPANVRVTSVRARTGSCTRRPLRCSFARVPARSSVLVSIRARATRRGGGRLVAAVVGAIRDPVRRNNVKVAGQRSRLRAELSISSRSTSATVQAGRRVIYRVVVHNRGPATARGIVVTQALPAGFAVVDVRGARCQARIVVCQVVPLRKGRSRTITVVTTTAKPRTTATLSSVLSSTYDPRSVNDVAASRSD